MVLHTAESTPDTVATDGGAEAVAEFIRTRSTPGSYHTLVDSDSRLQLVPWDMEAYQDGTGSNPHAVGLSVATRADWWPWAPQAWRDGAIEHLAQAAADYARWLHAKRGIVIPPRRITREESERRVPGFISHGERDPERRHDPGAQFPWDRFLHRYAQLTADLHGITEEDDMPTAQEIASAVWSHPLSHAKVSAPAKVVAVDTLRAAQIAAAKQIDVGELAEALAARLPGTAGPVKVTDLEEALRNVFGSLDEATG